MGKAERQGQNRWKRFIDAGVVEETLLWTDNPIEVDNTLGRTRDTLGLCGLSMQQWHIHLLIMDQMRN